MKPFIFLFALLFAPLLVAAEPSKSSNIIIVMGIFIFTAFAVVSYLLHKFEREMGPWVLLGIAAMLFTASEFVGSFREDISMQRILFIAAMAVFFLVAIIKFWDMMQYTD